MLKGTGNLWASSGCTTGKDPTKVYRPRTLRSRLESPVVRNLVNTGDIPTTLTRYIRVTQPATDAQRHWQPLGKQRVYYGKGSNKIQPSKTFCSQLESPVVRNLVNTGDIPTTLTRYIRVTQPATDSQRHWQPLGKQRVYYWKGSNKGLPSKTFRSRPE
jgi:hypothetical protein